MQLMNGLLLNMHNHHYLLMLIESGKTKVQN